MMNGKIFGSIETVHLPHSPKQYLLPFLFLFATLSLSSKGLEGLLPSYRHYLERLSPSISHAFYYRADTREKIVALTFDDGPMRRTPRLIAFLRERRIPATFFLVARQLNARNARLHDDPLFETGMHSWRHDDFRRLGPRATKRDFDRSIARFERFGREHRYFRAPYGMLSSAIVTNLRRRRIRGILWSLDSRDWQGRRGNHLVEPILRQLAPGSILLFHDAHFRPRDLQRIVDGIRARGYRIVPLSQLLRSPTLYP
ncbi:polysaccharide deacetylase family protein [Nitratifractor sp.]